VDLATLSQDSVLRTGAADVAVAREANRRHRLWRLAIVLAPFAVWAVVRALETRHGVRGGNALSLGFPQFSPALQSYLQDYGKIAATVGIAASTALGLHCPDWRDGRSCCIGPRLARCSAAR